ncbi:MAG TPA: hypothetical protein VHM48_09745 [Candidatus Limnocylindrales bacterium]|nr:hypothetical protein [Candidatus Limnocylindrales bacterium]
MNRSPARRHGLVVGLALLAAVISIPAAALLPAGAPFAVPAAAAATGGLTMTADARYTVDPARRRVHVAVALAATNHRTDTKTRRYFFDRAFLAVQPGTTGYKVTTPGAHPTVHVQRRASTYTLLRIDFGKQLGAGGTRRFKLTFDITDPGGAATRTTRIGTTLVSFGAWGFGSAGNPGGSVTVVFPAGFSIDVDAPLLGKPATDTFGNVTYATGRLASPLTFFAYFVADRPGAYKETTLRVTVDGKAVPITLRAWPDDPTWAKRVGSLLTRGLPALAKDIGLPWTVEQPLIVSEAISRNATGFSGRYNPPAGEIEIAYYATSFVVLHEAAHAWFDGGLLADRWASEGFASYYALRAAKAIGQKKVTGDVLTPALEKSRVPLNSWSAAGEDDATVEDAEYAAALKLATLIAARAGTDGLTTVWQAIRERRAAYQPTGPRASLETSDAAPDWRGLLDLLEERTAKTYDDLWKAWVVRSADEALLIDRANVGQRYAAVARQADTWLLPRVVRDALRAWQFDQANELLDGASTALDDRDVVLDATAAAGLTPPSTMQTDFEGPRGFAAASAEAEAELAAINAYRQTVATRPAEPDMITRIGLWNSDPSALVAAAVAAFSAGDLRASVESSAYARTIWTTAADIGRNRVLAIGASLAAVLVAGWLLLRWFRDRSSRRHLPIADKG